MGKTDYQARGVLWLPEPARFSHLLQVPEGSDLAKAINEAMKAIEEENESLKGVLPKQYTRLDNRTLKELFKPMNSIPEDIEGDAFGQIYEYFLGLVGKISGLSEKFHPSTQGPYQKNHRDAGDRRDAPGQGDGRADDACAP